MRKTIASILCAILVSAAVPLAAGENEKTNNTSVVIDSRPEHAEIRLNGKFIGTTPLSYQLAPGTHHIELMRPDFESWTRDLTVTNSPTRVVALLQSGHGSAPCAQK